MMTLQFIEILLRNTTHTRAMLNIDLFLIYIEFLLNLSSTIVVTLKHSTIPEIF